MPTQGPTDHAATGRTTVDDAALLDALRDWLPARRWFSAKGGEARLEPAGGLDLTDPRGEADVRVLLVRVRTATVDTVLQVPLTLYPAGTGSAAAPDGTGSGTGTGTEWVGSLGDVRIRDGAGDPPFLRAWLAAAQGPGAGPTALGLDTQRPRVISGEQSNTSVILPGPDGGAILKVFRALTPGENPDVDVPRRLVEQGWTHVPRPLGWLDGTWTTDDGEVSGSLGVLSEFVEGASDGFEMARDMGSRHESFGRLAEDLGRVVAGMHVALAAAVPVDDEDSGTGGDAGTGPEVGVVLAADADPAAAAEPGVVLETDATEGAGPGAGAGTTGAAADRAAAGVEQLAAAIEERFRWAAGSVPALEGWTDAVAARVEHVRSRAEVPPRQRVHGDLHLGQTLRARDRWFVLDFEGEPLSGAEARTRPDLALRDVAGMLRSFDYAAALSDAPPEWAAEARAEFLRGYAAETGAEPDAELVDLLELDKALYEAVYEARNRPEWSHVPQGALRRLLGGAGT